MLAVISTFVYRDAVEKHIFVVMVSLREYCMEPFGTILTYVAYSTAPCVMSCYFFIIIHVHFTVLKLKLQFYFLRSIFTEKSHFVKKIDVYESFEYQEMVRMTIRLFARRLASLLRSVLVVLVPSYKNNTP